LGQNLAIILIGTDFLASVLLSEKIASDTRKAKLLVEATQAR